MKNKIILILLPAVVSIIVLIILIVDEGTSSVNESFFEDKVFWRFHSKDMISATPAINDDQVFLRTASAITALSIDTGEVIWSAPSPSEIPLSSPPVIYGNYLVVPEQASGLAVFESSTGDFLWRTSGIEIAKSHHLSGHIRALSSLDDEILYVIRYDWALTAYELSTGKILWNQQFSSRGLPYLALEDEVVYVSLGDVLSAYDAKLGDLIWQIDTDGYWGAVLTDKETLYVIDEAEPGMLAIDLKTKQVVWQRTYPSMKRYETTCLSKNDDVLLIASGRLLAVSANNGDEVWKTETIGHLECPVVFGGELVVRNIQGRLFAFDLIDGKLVSETAVEKNTNIKRQMPRSPKGNDLVLVVPIDSYTLLALKR